MVSAIVVELPSSDEEEEIVPEVKPKASKGMSCSKFFFKKILNKSWSPTLILLKDEKFWTNSADF